MAEAVLLEMQEHIHRLSNPHEQRDQLTRFRDVLARKLT